MSNYKDSNEGKIRNYKFRKKPFTRIKPQTTEDKIKDFILRNSKNGFFTKIPTIERKFEISHDRIWENIGLLLSESVIECVHDEKTGDVKLCEFGKTYQILKNDQIRKKQRFNELKNKTNQKIKK